MLYKSKAIQVNPKGQREIHWVIVPINTNNFTMDTSVNLGQIGINEHLVLSNWFISQF